LDKFTLWQANGSIEKLLGIVDVMKQFKKGLNKIDMEIRIALIERGLESDLVEYGKQVQVIHNKIKTLKKKNFTSTKITVTSKKPI